MSFNLDHLEGVVFSVADGAMFSDRDGLVPQANPASADFGWERFSDGRSSRQGPQFSPGSGECGFQLHKGCYNSRYSIPRTSGPHLTGTRSVKSEVSPRRLACRRRGAWPGSLKRPVYENPAARGESLGQ